MYHLATRTLVNLLLALSILRILIPGRRHLHHVIKWLCVSVSLPLPPAPTYEHSRTLTRASQGLSCRHLDDDIDHKDIGCRLV
nr:L-threonine 3-dehydrogenase, mitochondrial-like protein [Pomacea canaliculata]